MKELKDSMDTIRLTAADFLEKTGQRWQKGSGAHDGDEYAEKLIADKERTNRFWTTASEILIVNFVTRSWMTGRQRKNLPTIWRLRLRLKNTEEINRLWEAEEKIENLPDGMIGLFEMHE